MMNFTFFANQKLVFGPGTLMRLPELVSPFGRRVLLVTGAASFTGSRYWAPLNKAFRDASIEVRTARIPGEPSPGDIDAVVAKARPVDAVAAIGGGSVLDAGKAVSAMLPGNEPVADFLEGVGTRSHDGRKLPFIAVPTTAGTGSEATKNAVISRVGEHGFKKSLRHDNLVPDIALIDPELARGCPPHVTAACGMDAVTQLLESLVSTQASPLTDALCLSGLEGLGPALDRAVLAAPNDLAARSRLAYAAYLSGLALANAGLGPVHGFASVIGGLFDIPHGVVCGALVGETCRQNIRALAALAPDSPALAKYARAGYLLTAGEVAPDIQTGCDLLTERLDVWTRDLGIPRLGRFGLTSPHIDRIADAAGQKNNPVCLSGEAMRRILEKQI